MLGKIIGVHESSVYVSLGINLYNVDNLVGKMVIFGDRYVGEVSSIVNNCLDVSIIGEIVGNRYLSGSLNFPPFNSTCRLINNNELNIIYGILPGENYISIGKSHLYEQYNVYLNVGKFFSNHFAILGNSGSGKSCFVTSLLQKIFYGGQKCPINSNIFLFDAYGEYQNAFNNISQYNSNLSYKVISTDLKNAGNNNLLLIPFWLLSVDDICLLLDVDDPKQIGIVEKALKLIKFFINDDSSMLEQKNDIIARALLDIIFSTSDHNIVRNKVVSVLSKFYTENINLDIVLTKGGWSRSLRQCISITESGNFADIEIIISYLESFCINEFQLSLPDGKFMYSLSDFYNSLEFALISEGIFSSSKVHDYANILKIRLNTLINSDYSQYFNCNNYIDKDSYIKYLLYTPDGRKCQIINFNINYVDDRLAKVIVKIFSKLLFDYTVSLPQRASQPIHIVLEEAHRYVQNDNDKLILGYNIFERIAKEGRKYGILLGVVSQRPSELSSTVFSQCSNFAVFKMFYKNDVKLVSDALGIENSINSSSRISQLMPGNCIFFGNCINIPIIAKVDLPNPMPSSDSCNINQNWYV